MRKIWIILIIAAVLIAGLLFLRGNEDNWITDEKGIYVKHGNPSQVPAYVIEQQEAIICALDLYNKAKETTMLESQCLGACGDYAVDIVHVPRVAEDDKEENQCAAFRSGELKHFIELDKEENIARVA
jgi:hypothetical protein